MSSSAVIPVQVVVVYKVWDTGRNPHPGTQDSLLCWFFTKCPWSHDLFSGSRSCPGWEKASPTSLTWSCAASETPTQLHLKPAIQQLLPTEEKPSAPSNLLFTRFLCPLLKYGSLSVLNVGKFFQQEKVLFKCKEMGIIFFCISPNPQ